ncbi:MAG: 5-formyltetrahydrofolate cyclo-ligase [Leucobacter sp.]
MKPGNDEVKRRIRREVRERRSRMDGAARTRARDTLTAQLANLVAQHGATSVACYAPLGTEPDTSGFLAWAAGHGVEVLLPIARPDFTLEWARLDPESHTAAMSPGRHGILEPHGPRLPAAAAADCELLLIPACAVDGRGGRLGWGLGYYDRLLATLDPRPPVFAVVYDADVLPSVPRDPHDAPITGVVTPSELRRFDG